MSKRCGSEIQQKPLNEEKGRHTEEDLVLGVASDGVFISSLQERPFFSLSWVTARCLCASPWEVCFVLLLSGEVHFCPP